MSNRSQLKERAAKPDASSGRVVNLGHRAAGDAVPVEADNHASLEQLKQTIVAMRHQMENSQLEQQRSAQEALAMANDEIAQLKRTIMAMREELESKARKK